MPLPPAWLDRLFSKLTRAYGAEFLRKWEGVPIDDVRSEWADVLDGFEKHPESIKYALDNLPSDRAPNAMQFRDLCRRSPAPKLVAIPAPPADPERLSEALKRLAGPVQRQGDRQWADALQKREQYEPKGQGASIRCGLTKFQKDAWREAKGFDLKCPATGPVSNVVEQEA